MTFRMSLRMTFKTWDFRGVFKEDYEGDLEGDLEGDIEGDLEGDMEGDLEGDLEGDREADLEGDSKGDFRGDCEQDVAGELLLSSGQLRSRSGLVQVWFSIELKFNSFELDSEVGRLVFPIVIRCRASDLCLPRDLFAEEPWQEPGRNPPFPFHICWGTRSTGCRGWRGGLGRRSPGGI